MSPAAAVVTTSWDDGHPLDLRVADLLEAYRLPGTFYAPRSIPSGAMTPSQLRSLSGRFEVGAHTLGHVDLRGADDATAREEIRGSRAWVEDVTGRPCTVFCPPMGHFGGRDLALVRGAGYAGLRTVELLSVAPPRRRGGLVLVPTTVQAHPHRWPVYARNGLRRLAPGNLLRSVLHARSSDWVRAAESLARLALRRGGVFHLWGHSWEIEENGQWGRLEEVFALLSGLAGGARMLTNGELCGAVTAGPGAPAGAARS